MPTEQEWVKIESDAQAKWEEIIERRPGEEWVGFYSYGDAPPAIGGGTGCFTWFPDWAEMVEFIAAVLPFNPPGPSGSDHLETQNKVRAAIERHTSEKASPNSLRKELNLALTSYSQIDWFGTFADLKAGKGEFPQKVLASYRDVEDEDDAGKPEAVSADEEDEFLEFLGEYGL